MGMTLAEKILAKNSGRAEAAAGEFVVADIGLAMIHDIFAARVFDLLLETGAEGIADPDRVVVVIDHFVPAPTPEAADLHRRIREHVKNLGVGTFYDAGEGICHQLLPERGHVRPGMLIVGSDSHTTTHGALGAAATGIGTSEMVYALAMGKLWFQVPETIRFDMTGRLQRGVVWKDVILHLAGRFGADVAQYKSIEFGGPAVAGTSMSSRLTVSNMAVEIGAKFGLFASDEVTDAYLRGQVGAGAEPLDPDPDANYEAVHEISLDDLDPQVARPSEIDLVSPVGEVEGDIIEQAFIGSCTNGRYDDLEAAATVLEGRRVADGVRLLVAPASRTVLQQAADSGVLGTLIAAGATVLPSGCGPCFGGHGGLLGPGERAIGTHNRNFVGRMGSAEAGIYLASPATVAASAVAGHVADPRKLEAVDA